MVRANIPHVITDDSALGGQLIGGSLRFNRVSNSVGTYLKRTPSVAGNRKKFALSVWLKRCGISFWQRIFAATPDGSNVSGLAFRGDGNTDGIRLQMQYGSVNKHWTSTGKYRDTNAWYHIVLSVDLAASSGQRVILYVNGVRDVGSWVTGTEPDSSNQYGYNSVTEHQIGGSTGVQTVFDGYMTQFYWLDGINATQYDFGYTESQTGIWRPKKYTGTFGTNGFYIPMDGSSAVGKDMSGNGNDYIPIKCGTVPIGKATGAFPIMNTNNGATVPLPGFRPDPFASNLVFASTFSDPSDVLDVHHLIKGSGSEKGCSLTGTTKEISQSNFYGRSGSLFFNGSGDKVTMSSSSDFALGTGDFTIELWFKKTTSNASEYLFDFGTNQLSMYFLTTDRLYYYANAGGSNTGNVEIGTVGINEWNHVAAVRQSGVIKLFLNGKLTHTQNEPRDWSSAQNFTIGQYGGGGNYSFEGYMQDFRLYKGVAKYTEEFLCGAVDSSIVEDSPSGIAIPRKLDPTIGGSVALHTTADVDPSIIVASNSDLYLDGDFTIEFWIYLNSISSDTHNPSIITFPDNSGIGQVYINAGNKYYSLFWPSSDIGRSAYKSAKTGRWQYITITRSSNAVKLFIDGVLSGDATSSQAFGNAYGGIRIGGYTQNTGNIDGHISNLRIIKGTALYTSSFTPPTEPLTNVTGTSLLCFQSKTDVEDFTVDKNASTLNNKNWTRSGTFSWSIGADSSVTQKFRQFDGTIETGSAGAPNGNPGNVRFTFDSPITGITKCRIRANTHNDTYQYRRTYYNGANGTNSIQTGSNTTAWHDVTSNVGNTLNWVEWGSYGGADADRGPYGCNGIEINDVLLTDRFRDNDGHGDKSSASHFSPFDTDIVQEGPSQYAILNANAHEGVTLSNGNLTNTGGNDIPSNMGVKTGKFYVEVRIDTANSGSNLKHLGIFATGTRTFRGTNNNSHIIANLDGVMIRSDAAGPYTYTGRGGATSFTQVFNDSNQIFTLGDIVGIQLDMDNKFVKFYINGSLRTHYTFVLASTFDKMYFFGRNNGSGITTWNFGQKPYRYTPPTEFLPLASHNLESATLSRPQKHFDTLIYSGNSGSSNVVTGLEFQPDFIWIKARSGSSSPGSQNHYIVDSVRGATGSVTKKLYPNSTGAENSGQTDANNGIKILPNGIELTSSNDGTNSNNAYVAWCWKAGGNSNTFNVDGTGYASASAAGITEGNLALTGASINKESGFSIVRFTANNSASATIGHGLNSKPNFVIVKDTANTDDWQCKYIVDNIYLALNSNAAGSTSYSSYTATDTLINLGYTWNNGSGTHIVYSWTNVPGYSKIGSYTGNGNTNGPYIDCGFRPSWIMFKRTNDAKHWWIVDSKRDDYNPSGKNIHPNLTNVEGTNYYVDFLGNGFKLRVDGLTSNGDGGTFIYMAFAEQPEVTPFGSQSNAR